MSARALRAEAALAGNSEADESVRRTLVLAQRTAEMAVREANDEATQIRAAARTEADRIVTEVKVEAHRVESDAAQRAAAIEQDADQARAAAIEQATTTIDAANATAEATLRDAARQAAALEADITEEVARRRAEVEAEIDGRRLQALQDIEDSVGSLRIEREQLALDVSTLGDRLDAERSHVLDALRSATARLEAAFGTAARSADDDLAFDPSSASLRTAGVIEAADGSDGGVNGSDGGDAEPSSRSATGSHLGDDSVAESPVVGPVAEESPEVPGPVGDGRPGDESAGHRPMEDEPEVEGPADWEPVTDGLVADESTDARGSVGDEPATWPVLDEPADEHRSVGDGPVGAWSVVDLAEEDASVGDAAEAHASVDDPSVGDGPETAVAFAAATSSETDVMAATGAPAEGGPEPGDGGDAPNLTVLDGWAGPDSPEADERAVHDDASDPWGWSPEPEVVATPAATWFPEAGLDDPAPDHDHVSAGDAWGAWSEDQGSTWSGAHGESDAHGEPPTPETPERSDAGGRSTIFQPVAGWASAAASAPASEPWSVWGAGPAPSDAVRVDPSPTGPSTWQPSWQAEQHTRQPAAGTWQPAGDPAPWGGDEPAAPPSDDLGSEPMGGSATESTVGVGTAQPVGAPTSGGVGPEFVAPPGWEPAPGDFHDPWRDLPAMGGTPSQAEDAPPSRLLFTLEDDGRPAEPGGDSSPDAKPRKSLLGRRRI